MAGDESKSAEWARARLAGDKGEGQRTLAHACSDLHRGWPAAVSALALAPILRAAVFRSLLFVRPRQVRSAGAIRPSLALWGA